jgi:branched-chain amino acid transport system substrate-binding protein
MPRSTRRHLQIGDLAIAVTTGRPRRAGRSALIVSVAAAIASFASLPAGAQEVVKLGEIEAQTGSLNTYGWMSAQGTRMAVDKINKDGGFQVGGKT